MRKRILSILLVLCLCLGLLPATAWAIEAETLNVTATNSDSVTSNENIGTNTTDYTITEDVTVTGTTTSSRLIVTGNVTVTLDDAAIDLKDTHCIGSPIEIRENSEVTLILKGKNTLSAHAGGPGILVGQEAKLTIKKAEGQNTSTLTVEGAQYSFCEDTSTNASAGHVTVDASGGYAGIGSDNHSEVNAFNFTGTINIESGAVTATGYGYGAAIGGGKNSSGGTIHISGGIVTAINGGTDPDGWNSDIHKQAAGIGGSREQLGGKITISGGAIVTAYGGRRCPGIGGSGAEVTISGSGTTVTATGGAYGAGIGAAYRTEAPCTISITGSAAVTAYGGAQASGIGQGDADSPVTLTIGSGTTVKAYSDGAKAAITGTPAAPAGEGNLSSILNIYMQDVVIPDSLNQALGQLGGLPLTITKVGEGQAMGDSKIVIVATGYVAVGTNVAVSSLQAPLTDDPIEEGTYSIALNLSALGIDSTRLGGVDSFQILPRDIVGSEVTVGSSTDAYGGTRLMLMATYTDGSIQRNPFQGPIISSGNNEALKLDDEGNITVPPGGTIKLADGSEETWELGGTVYKNSGLAPIFDENFVFTADLPSSLYISRGSKLELSVTVPKPKDGSTVSYQWYKDGALIEGATGSSLTVEKAADENLGAYHVLVTRTLSGVTNTLRSQTCTVRYYVPMPTYPPTMEDSEGGDTTVTPSNPTTGQTVTIKPNPDEGYEVEEVTVTDRNGNEVEVTDNGDGTYSFTQPSGSVTITVTYTEDKCDGTDADNCPLLAFDDLNPSEWYHEYVEYAIENGLMVGTGDTTFSPETPVTRAQVVTVLWRLENEPEVNYAMTFEDVAADQWYTEAVRWAASLGIVGGYSDAEYGTDDYITRQDMATILYRYAAYKGYDVSASGELDFTDAEDVKDYALAAMQWVCGAGIYEGNGDGTVNPIGDTRRCEYATLMMRFIENIVK